MYSLEDLLGQHWQVATILLLAGIAGPTAGGI
jgi:hypothetical protein